MRQAEPLARVSSTEQQRAHRGGLAHADRAHGGGDVGHCVVDGETGGYGPSGGVDVEVDGLLGVVGFKEEELGHDAGGHGFVDFAV